jgi:hypothetical protein
MVCWSLFYVITYVYFLSLIHNNEITPESQQTHKLSLVFTMRLHSTQILALPAR